MRNIRKPKGAPARLSKWLVACLEQAAKAVDIPTGLLAELCVERRLCKAASPELASKARAASRQIGARLTERKAKLQAQLSGRGPVRNYRLRSVMLANLRAASRAGGVTQTEVLEECVATEFIAVTTELAELRRLYGAPEVGLALARQLGLGRREHSGSGRARRVALMAADASKAR